MRGDFTRFSFRRSKHYSGVLRQQGRVALDSDFNEQVEIDRHRSRTLTRDLIGACGGPRDAAGFRIALDRTRKRLLIGAGRYYVDGLLVENEASCAFDEQPDLPMAGEMLRQAVDRPGRYLLFLEVWERTITAVEDPDLLEPALGGPDTSVRLKVVWQVRLAPLREARRLGCGGRRGDEAEVALDVRADAGGYVGLENRLYRVEVHSADKSGGGTVKWSRDNASVVFPVLRVNAHALELGTRPSPTDEGLRVGDLVEVMDDALELDGRVGQLVEIERVEDRVLGLVEDVLPLAETETGVDPARHPKVRRWHGIGRVTPDWTPLEDGIEVRFGGNGARVGDYWTIPARASARRTAADPVDWVVAEPPARTDRVCCPLAVVEFSDGRWNVREDRRRLFAPRRAVRA